MLINCLRESNTNKLFLVFQCVSVCVVIKGLLGFLEDDQLIFNQSQEAESDGKLAASAGIQLG